MANVQVLDRAQSMLKIEAQRGFEQPFLNFFERVHDGQAVCGMALSTLRRVAVEDITQSPLFLDTPALEVMLDAGVRAVQSTPLLGRSEQVLGVFSTHYRKPTRFSESDLRLLDDLSFQVARVIELHRF
jgi:GAF domain-containing protein